MVLNAEKIYAQLMQAHQLYGAGRYNEAAALYREVLIVDPVNRDALQTLVAMALQTGRMDEAEEYLGRLAASWPAEPAYTIAYSNALARRGQYEAAIQCYERLMSHKPRHADSRYNYALLLKQIGRLEASLEQYQKALSLGISNREEVFSNMSLVLSALNRHGEAESALEKALACNRRHVPALYNLGLLHEEHGRREEARQLFRRVLKQAPGHPDALARLAYTKTADIDDAIIARLTEAAASPELSDADRETLLYALGKVHDDCGRFDEAFDYYSQANHLSRDRTGSYERQDHEALIDALMDPLKTVRIDNLAPVSDAPLVFICGMFRSGSTLLEQMLGAHPALVAGGELTWFNDQAPLPDGLASLDEPALQRIGLGYLDHLRQLFPDSARVIDKRPDNYLYIGIIGRLFPNARFLNTRRQPLDNCLSVYFQQLTDDFKYSNEVLDVGHYYLQYRRLMSWWRQQLPGRIIDVAYDELVKDPEPILRTALAFLDLDWDPACLDFHERDNRVRTASVWQVRQPLHLQSSGRWENYEAQLAPLREYFQDHGITID